ncbi:MAG: uridine diphosphate-N-acetylglucosamine-binding protein YvcK [Propionibacteriaceae bacterium]|nr:uridine diphosphate-N-acetylglucosamine-binding protein YvcK [Propionibacteriaceae bacterium]
MDARYEPSPRLPRVVAFGGGHGLAATLKALKRLTDDLTAIVTVADDGGSSGRLRREFGCLPPGDLRMALAALCGDDSEGRLWADVLQRRFVGEGPLAGHAVGNLLITGLWQSDSDPVVGLDHVASLVHAKGRVLPMSSVPLAIEAEVIGLDRRRPDDVVVIRGQADIAATPGQVISIALDPADPPVGEEALAAIAAADYLILGPGSWFTSVLPHLLVPALAEAIVTSPARRILIMNLLASKETSGFTPSQHIEVLAEHEPRLRLDTVIADPRFAADPHLARYVASLGGSVFVAPVGARDGSPRHDPNLLAAALAAVLNL